MTWFFLVKCSVIIEKAPSCNFDNFSNVLRLNWVKLIPNYTLLEAKTQKNGKTKSSHTSVCSYPYEFHHYIILLFFFTSFFMCIWWFYCIILQVLKNKVAIFALKSARKTEGHMAIGQYKKARRLSLNSYSPQCNAFFLAIAYTFPDTSV